MCIRDSYADAAAWLDEFPNLIVTRTFSKIYGLAGLRVGYAVSSAQIADWFNRARQPFNVSAVAQAAALAALRAPEYVERSRAFNRAGLEQLRQGCDALELAYLPSAANFLCVAMPSGASRAPAIYEYLLERGVVVRPVENYGLPNHLRVTAGHEQENAAFLTALRAALDSHA